MKGGSHIGDFDIDSTFGCFLNHIILNWCKIAKSSKKKKCTECDAELHQHSVYFVIEVAVANCSYGMCT